MSEIFNNIDRKTWREIKETLQWPPMENQLVVYTQIVVLHCAFFFCKFLEAMNVGRERNLIVFDVGLVDVRYRAALACRYFKWT